MVSRWRVICLCLLVLLAMVLWERGIGPTRVAAPGVAQGESGEGPEPFPTADLFADCEEVWARLRDPSNERWRYLRSVWHPGLLSQEASSCWVGEEERHIFAEARPGWVRYTNERFGFSVEVPVDWYRGCPPVNGDGLSFFSPDGLVRVTFYGFNNVMDGSNRLSLQTLDEYTKGQGEPIVVDGHPGRDIAGTNPYAAPGSDDPCTEGRWIVLLEERAGRGIVLVSPTPLFDEYSLLLGEILATYRAGPLD